MKQTIVTLLRPTVIPHDAAVVLDFVPPLQRRRLSRLQQRHFALAHQIASDQPQDYRVIFASQDGEDDLTRKLVAAFNDEGDVSPMRFSTSVYNAAPGLYSIFTKNKASYSAIAAEDETLDCSLLEALLADEPCLWTYAEETNQTPALGVMFFPGKTDGIVCEYTPGNPAAPNLTPQDVEAFFTGQTTHLHSRYFTLSRL